MQVAPEGLAYNTALAVEALFPTLLFDSSTRVSLAHGFRVLVCLSQ
jgi:hypothetical protein